MERSSLEICTGRKLRELSEKWVQATMNKVSIIIPSYGQAKYLGEAIESAVAQTVPSEVIVVDDGSTDGSLELAKSFGDKIKLIQQVNKGLASARNTGVMNATGDMIFPLDADDVMMVTCVEKLLRLATLHPEADVFAPSFQTIGLVMEHVTLMQSPTIDDFRTGNRIGYFSMIRKAALLEVGGYSPKMVEGYEDLHLWYNLLTRGKKIVTTPEILVLYRIKEESMWKTASGNHHLKLMNQIYHDFPNILPHA